MKEWGQKEDKERKSIEEKQENEEKNRSGRHEEEKIIESTGTRTPTPHSSSL
jgi:hypothetical protein